MVLVSVFLTSGAALVDAAALSTSSKRLNFCARTAVPRRAMTLTLLWHNLTQLQRREDAERDAAESACTS